MVDLEPEDRFLANVFQKMPAQAVKGSGALLWDSRGKQYFDCLGAYGTAIVGHNNPAVVKAIQRQAERLISCHCSIYNDARSRFIEKLVHLAPKGLEKAYFSNSGAEAVECAIKLARKYSRKQGIISMVGGYHGKTMGALSVTWNRKYRDPFQPLLSGVKFATYGDVEKVRDFIDDSIGAIIAEPIQGEGGVHIPPSDFLPALRELCDEKGILLIFDEIQTGLGRTGKLWASEHWNVTPDIMLLGKGVAGGVPMGVTLARMEVMDAFKPGDHTSTFSGNPLACAAGEATLDYIVTNKLPEAARDKGKFFKDKLDGIAHEQKIVREVRGLGLMLAVESRFEIRDILLACFEKGLMLLYSGKNILRLLPPLVIERDQLEGATAILHEVISAEGKTKFAT